MNGLLFDAQLYWSYTKKVDRKQRKVIQYFTHKRRNKLWQQAPIPSTDEFKKSNCSISNTYINALRDTLLFLQKKDKIDKTSYYPLAQSIFCESSSKTVTYFSLNQPASPTTIYSYKKYILKTFYCCYAELTNLPYTDDFDEIIKYLSA